MSTTVKLNVVQPYRNREVSYPAGQVIEVSTELAAWLMADAPGCFEPEVKPKAVEAPPVNKKAVELPPVDKMVRAPRVKK